MCNTVYLFDLRSCRCLSSESFENGDSERTATFTLDISDDENGSAENSLTATNSIDQNSTLSVDSMKMKFGGSNSKRHFRFVYLRVVDKLLDRFFKYKIFFCAGYAYKQKKKNQIRLLVTTTPTKQRLIVRER